MREGLFFFHPPLGAVETGGAGVGAAAMGEGRWDGRGGRTAEARERSGSMEIRGLRIDVGVVVRGGNRIFRLEWRQ